MWMTPMTEARAHARAKRQKAGITITRRGRPVLPGGTTAKLDSRPLGPAHSIMIRNAPNLGFADRRHTAPLESQAA